MVQDTILGLAPVEREEESEIKQRKNPAGLRLKYSLYRLHRAEQSSGVHPALDKQGQYFISLLSVTWSGMLWGKAILRACSLQGDTSKAHQQQELQGLRFSLEKGEWCF
jgi:hypothetical protein